MTGDEDKLEKAKQKKHACEDSAHSCLQTWLGISNRRMRGTFRARHQSIKSQGMLNSQAIENVASEANQLTNTYITNIPTEHMKWTRISKHRNIFILSGIDNIV
jgi:hypothetical protein